MKLKPNQVWQVGQTYFTIVSVNENVIGYVWVNKCIRIYSILYKNIYQFYKMLSGARCIKN